MGVNIIDVGVSRISGAREYQEDRYVTLLPGSLKSRKELAIFAVYDGHGGADVVNHVAQHLHTHLEQHFTNPKAANATEYKHAIQCALRAVDRELSRADLDGGSTVTLVLVDTKQNLLVQANLGDSHCYFADHDAQSPQSLSPHSPTRNNSTTSQAGWNVEPLSVEHTPDSPLEKRRIEESGGEINYTSGIALGRDTPSGARVGAPSPPTAMELSMPMRNKFRDPWGGINVATALHCLKH
ncbi:uncharacterized protein SETTUDRAFT_21672 [Exserohilum turcica Et28A]|uniref:protein-serine/threonine phosphatase n=1 Tax=Exserohilum turcicum (strain 28A) TaxID=671987 RepID=R0IH52_EXST2|nr:uncharacterized protein SETTUDRAFT_21672 [Exserohilum turcica Et28A]EOA84316.1 hypothetical protein SETTUDRAFT_21672 [Exserohilum turcica Et28A]